MDSIVVAHVIILNRKTKLIFYLFIAQEDENKQQAKENIPCLSLTSTPRSCLVTTFSFSKHHKQTPHV